MVGTVDAIAQGKIVGWFQGRMEFGPRALGNRSILADPRRRNMKEILNSRIKYREPFRPFCPSILAERVGEYFEIDYPSPFMVMAYKIRAGATGTNSGGDTRGRDGKAADGRARGESTVLEADSQNSSEVTGVPVLLNTSFNENEPIVQTPAQAIDCFLRTQMDVLSIGSVLVAQGRKRASE